MPSVKAVTIFMCVLIAVWVSLATYLILALSDVLNVGIPGLIIPAPILFLCTFILVITIIVFVGAKKHYKILKSGDDAGAVFVSAMPIVSNRGASAFAKVKIMFTDKFGQDHVVDLKRNFNLHQAKMLEAARTFPIKYIGADAVISCEALRALEGTAMQNLVHNAMNPVSGQPVQMQDNICPGCAARMEFTATGKFCPFCGTAYRR